MFGYVPQQHLTLKTQLQAVQSPSSSLCALMRIQHPLSTLDKPKQALHEDAPSLKAALPVCCSEWPFSRAVDNETTADVGAGSVPFCSIVGPLSDVMCDMWGVPACDPADGARRATLAFKFNELFLHLPHWEGPRYSRGPEPWGGASWPSTASGTGTPKRAALWQMARADLLYTNIWRVKLC